MAVSESATRSRGELLSVRRRAPRLMAQGRRRVTTTYASLNVRADARHVLPDGLALETIAIAPEAPASGRPPLLFVHGSYHGAWCWAEKWQPYLAERGFRTLSVSFRAQGKSERAAGMKFAGTLRSHADDLESVVKSMGEPPVMVAHSFGGLVAELYASQPRSPLAGIACLSSVPPTGNGDIIKRITKRSFVDSAKITWGFITKSFLKSSADTRFLFFSDKLDESSVLKYQRLLQENASPVPLLDVRNLNAELPIPKPMPATFNSKAFVGGGSADGVVDPPAVEEPARHFGVQPTIWSGLGHDVMLDADADVVAADLLAWLESL